MKIWEHVWFLILQIQQLIIFLLWLVLLSPPLPCLDPISIAGLSVPKLWLYILGNCVTQYVCIRGVFVLTTECPSLIVTLVVTLRKFVSLLFSIFYFQNPFTVQHWIATALVFGGTGLFSGIFNPILNLLFPPPSPSSKKTKPGLADGQVKSSKLD